MKLQQILVNWTEAYWYPVVMILLMILAFLGIPTGFAAHPKLWQVLGVLGILAYFDFLFLVRYPVRFLTIRTIGLIGICAGIFASPNFIPQILELTFFVVSRERSIAVSTVLLMAGLATLTVFWILNFVASCRRISASRSIHGSDPGNGSDAVESSSTEP